MGRGNHVYRGPGLGACLMHPRGGQEDMWMERLEKGPVLQGPGGQFRDDGFWSERKREPRKRFQ